MEHFVMDMKIDDVNGFEFVEGLSGKSGFWVCGKGNGGDFSAVRVYMRKMPPLPAPERSAVAKGKNVRGAAFLCNTVRSPFYNANSSLITGIVITLSILLSFLTELMMPRSVIPWSTIVFFLSIFAGGFLLAFFSDLPQVMEFSREGVSFFVNGRLLRKISAAALRQIYFVKSELRIGGENFEAFRLIAVVEDRGRGGSGRLSSLTLLENIPFYESALFLENESERMMSLQDVPMTGEARQRGDSCAMGSLDSASVGLSSMPLSLGSLEKDGTVASLSGTGDDERLEVRVRTRPLGPWSDFAGWNRGKCVKALIFPFVSLAVFLALFFFLPRSVIRSFLPGTLIFVVPAVFVLLFFVVFCALVLLNWTDFSILFSKDFVVVSRASRPYFEKVIQRGEISQIYCKEYTVKSDLLYELLLLDSGAGKRSLVLGIKSFDTAKFIERNAERIMGIVGQKVEGEV